MDAVANLVAFLALALLCVFVSCDENENMSTQNIELRPAAGLKHAELKHGKIICKFHYRVQGGTYETWQMSVEHDKEKKQYTCSVGREHSYLFFEEFGVDIINGTPEQVHIRPGDVDPSQYVIDAKEGTVRSTDAFKNKLLEVSVVAVAKPTKKKKQKRQKKEL